MITWPHDVGFTLSICEPGRDWRECHGLGDAAAEIASVVQGQGLLDAKLDEFLGALSGRLQEACPNDRTVIDAVHQLRCATNHLVEEGARLGFALALTVPASAEGWQAWGAAAVAHRTRSHCTPDSHTDEIAAELSLVTAALNQHRTAAKPA